MSAFILSDKHFQIIAQYVANNTGLDAQIIADKLKRINVESVNYRYGEKTRVSKVKFDSSFDINTYPKFDVIQLIKCWSYQSCENGLSLDFLMMDAYLLSFFDNDELNLSGSQSSLWSI
jgi:hypothetical protein